MVDSAAIIVVRWMDPAVCLSSYSITLSLAAVISVFIPYFYTLDNA